jgi:hypothetical protein
MMSEGPVTAREQLISDWRKRLAAAEASPDAGSLRAAWLVHMRRRLYRFLLSLYGDGAWRSSLPDEVSQTTNRVPAGVVFDSADTLPLAGKPAKSEGTIRAVLKAVAGAQDQPYESGPWVQGFSQGEWVVVCAASDGLDLARCVQLLGSEGIVTRCLQMQSDVVIAVPAILAPQARTAVRSNLRRLRRPPPSKPIRKASSLVFWLLIGIGFTPPFWVLSFIISSARYPDAVEKGQAAAAAWYAAAVFAALMALIYVRPIARLVQVIDRIVMAMLTLVRKNVRRRVR